jgi:uncharacterized membrane protein YbhN (UPF0104 family)
LPGGSVHIRKILQRGVVLAIGVILLYFMQQRLQEFILSADRLREVAVGWMAAMVGFEILSFICMWALIRVVLPDVSWFIAGTSQLVSNSVSRLVPGGAAVGGATLYRMLSASGVGAPQAASAMAATGILSNALLFAIPTVAGLMALAGAPIPERMLPAAIAGAVLFGLLMVFGAVAMLFTRPLLAVSRGIASLVAMLGRLARRDWSFDPDRVIGERDRLVRALGPRWPRAIAAAAGNWAFDYLALIAALYAVGAEPRLSLVLLAFAAAAVLGMVPFTPGGVGFVEVGLYSTLVISGISARDASVATIAYRMISWALPVVSGLIAWIVFKSRFPGQQVGDEPAVAG